MDVGRAQTAVFAQILYEQIEANVIRAYARACTAGQFGLTHSRTCATDVFSTLSVGACRVAALRDDVRVRRGVPAAVPALRWVDADSIAFITNSADIREILGHIGVDSEPPHIFPARRFVAPNP